MLKTVVITILVLMMVGLVFLVSDIKDAYKVIPIKTSTTMEVPPFADWREYTAQSEKFKVNLPEPPQFARESDSIQATDLKRYYEMYISQQLNGTIYMISLITYPPGMDVSDEKQTMHEVIADLARNREDNQLKEEKATIYKDKPATEFLIVNKEVDMKGLTFMVDKTLYLLSYVAHRDNFTLQEYDRFINSFQLLSKN